MANTTNYNWETPDDTDLVKDGAAAIRTLGSSIDTTTKNLNPETTTGDIAYRSATANTNTRLAIGSSGQVLTVAAGVPSWATPTVGDITEVQAGTGISVASGTGPIPVVTNTVATAIDAKGDLIVGTGADTFARLAVGTNGQVLTADSSEATGLKFATPASGDIEGIVTGTDSGLSGGATSGTVTLRQKLEFDAETGTTYTLVAGNLNQLVTLNNASPITLTVPPSVFSAGDVINIAQIGAGQVTLAQGAGVTITSTGATSSAPKLRANKSAASIICTASNTFLVIGDIA